LLLFALWLLFFHDLVLHPGQVLYSDHSDLLAEHIPAKRFLVRSFQETGDLPRWCPYQFAGYPFLHDIQVAAFYPPHALLLLLDERHVGTALSWLLAVHVLLAGWFMHSYAKEQGFGSYGSFVAAVGYMFAGKWLLHLLAAGHYVLIGLAWLPLVLLFLERAIRRGSIGWATAAGVAFALLTLGTHPQWTFYAGLLIIPWTLPVALEQTGSRVRSLGSWLGFGAWTALVSAGLSAVQLLPTAEAAPLSIRSVEMPLQNFRDEVSKTMLVLVGPGPHGGWEHRGGFGVLWLAVASAAPLLCKGRIRFQAAVFLGLFLLALGGAVWLQPLPIFRSFRTPARMFVLAALPLATLAGAVTHALFEQPLPPHRLRRICFLVMLAAGLFAVLLGYLELRQAGGAEWRSFVTPYWLVSLVTLPALFFVLLHRWRAGTSTGKVSQAAVLWIFLLVADLWAMTGPLVQVRSGEEIFAPSKSVRYLIQQREADKNSPWRVVDQGAPDDPNISVLGTGSPLSTIERLEGLGGYNPLDVLRTRQYFQFIGGSDQPVRPMEGDLGKPVLAAFPLREKKLLDLLGVRFLLRTKNGPWKRMEGEQEGDWRVVAEDHHPRAYNFATGGLRDLPPYAVLENRAEAVFPRAFAVPEARRMPEEAEVLAALKANDFRRVVLLEDFHEERVDRSQKGSSFREARVQEYRPNQVRIEVPDGDAGWLVLTDVWYPGWKCKVDGNEMPIYRANYLFRAVAVPAGSHEVLFTFEPRSYLLGRIISGVTLLLAGAILVVSIVRSRKSHILK
jgi:hypothetical protein